MKIEILGPSMCCEHLVRFDFLCQLAVRFVQVSKKGPLTEATLSQAVTFVSRRVLADESSRSLAGGIELLVAGNPVDGECLLGQLEAGGLELLAHVVGAERRPPVGAKR